MRTGGPAKNVRVRVPKPWNQNRRASWNGASFVDCWMRKSTGCPRRIAVQSCFVTLRGSRTRRRHAGCGARRGACAGGWTEHEKLRDRLTRRGVAPLASLTALVASGEAASASVIVPPPLVAGTVATLARTATASAVSATGSTAALELAESVFRAMFVAKLKLAGLLVAGILALGTLPFVVALEPAGRRRRPETIRCDRGARLRRPPSRGSP